MQFFTAILLFNDALAYIFRGCVGSLGHYMVRISNFMVFILSDVIMFFFHVYVCSYLFEDGVYFMSNIEQENGFESYGMLQEQEVDRLLAVPLKREK